MSKRENKTWVYLHANKRFEIYQDHLDWLAFIVSLDLGDERGYGQIIWDKEERKIRIWAYRDEDEQTLSEELEFRVSPLSAFNTACGLILKLMAKKRHARESVDERMKEGVFKYLDLADLTQWSKGLEYPENRELGLKAAKPV